MTRTELENKLNELERELFIVEMCDTWLWSEENRLHIEIANVKEELKKLEK